MNRRLDPSRLRQATCEQESVLETSWSEKNKPILRDPLFPFSQRRFSNFEQIVPSERPSYPVESSVEEEGVASADSRNQRSHRDCHYRSSESTPTDRDPCCQSSPFEEPLRRQSDDEREAAAGSKPDEESLKDEEGYEGSGECGAN